MAEEMMPDFSEAVTTMMNKIHGEEGFDAAFDLAMDNILASSGKLAEGIAEVEKVLGIEEGGLGSITSTYYTDATEGAKEYAKAQQENIDNAIKEKDILLDVYEAAKQVASGYLDIESAASKAAQASNDFIQQEYKEDADDIGAEKRGEDTTSQTPAPVSTPAPATNTSSNTGTSSSKPSLSVGSSVKVKSGAKWYANSYGGGSSGNARAGKIKYINLNGSYPYNIDGLGWVKKSSIVGYDTGGYTGTWNDNKGKLAFLHQKELVLNAKDTENMLSTIKEFRAMYDSNLLGRQLIQSRLEQTTAALAQEMALLCSNVINANNSENNNSSIEIYADFPAATSTYEIEAAFTSLINNASQYTHSTRR